MTEMDVFPVLKHNLKFLCFKFILFMDNTNTTNNDTIPYTYFFELSDNIIESNVHFCIC